MGKIVYCPSCGAECDSDEKFCMDCGAALPKKQSPKPRFCPVCGDEIPAAAQFCASCGTRVPAARSSTSRETVEDVDVAPSRREPETRYAKKVSRNQYRSANDVPAPPEGADEDGNIVVEAEDYFAYKNAQERGSRTTGQAGQQYDSSGSNDEWDAELEHKKMLQRRRHEQENRYQEDDLELPEDADIDVGDPMSYLAEQAKNKHSSNNNRSRQDEEYDEDFSDDDFEDDEIDEDEDSTRGKSSKKKLEHGSKKRFQTRANSDHYYDDRRVDDDGLNMDERKATNKFTLILGIVGIIAFAAVMLLVRNIL